MEPERRKEVYLRGRRELTPPQRRRHQKKIRRRLRLKLEREAG